MDIRHATMPEIGGLRERVPCPDARSVEQAAEHFTSTLAHELPDIVLCRLFAVVPFERLPPPDGAFATSLAGKGRVLGASSPVLSLLGTYGREPAWQSRQASVGHLAIPLVSGDFVSRIPMVSALLRALHVDLADLDDAPTFFTRRMEGGRNGALYVGDARSVVDAEGRRVISADFVESYGVRTVFAMGGPYIDGTLVAIIVFTDVDVPKLATDRFASFVSNFKMATQSLVMGGRIYR
jgi:hypothetical protein